MKTRIFEALSTFVSDSDGHYRNMNEEVDVEQISWRMAAHILVAASLYE